MDNFGTKLNENTLYSLPKGLKERVLSAVHLEQQREIRRQRYVFRAFMSLVVLGLVSSVALSVGSASWSSIAVIIETMVSGYNNLSFRDLAFSLVENVSVTGLAATFILATLTSLLASQWQKKNFRINLPIYHLKHA